MRLASSAVEKIKPGLAARCEIVDEVVTGFSPCSSRAA